MDILVAYRGIPHARGWALGACLSRALKKLGHSVWEYGNYYRTAERVSNIPLPSKVTLLIYCECNDLDPQYTELKSLSTKWKVYWDFDVHAHLGKTLSFVKDFEFTHIFFANNLYEEIFLSLCPHTYYLPIGFDDKLHRPFFNMPKSVDVGLCGSPYPGRITLIEKLKEAGINATLASGKCGEEYVRTVNSFNIHLNYMVGGGRGLLPGRVWETLGCGTLLLTEKADFIELFFQDMRHVVLYATVEECIDKINYLLAHPSELQRIAEVGHKYALKHHTYIHRAQSILDAVMKKQPPPWHDMLRRVSPGVIIRSNLIILNHRLMSQMPIRLRHLRHPICSARSLYHKVSRRL